MTESEEAESTSFLTLPLDGGPRDFEDLEELAAWAKDQRDSLSWLQTATKNQANIQHAWNTLNDCIGKVENFSKRHSQLNEQQQASEAQALTNHFAGIVKSGRIRTTGSPDVTFINALRKEESDAVAAHAYAFLTNHDFQTTSAASFAGAHHAMRYKLGSTDTVKAQKSALESVKRSWSVKFGKLHQKLKTDSEGIHSDLEGKQSAFDSLIVNVKKENNDQKTAFNDLCKSAKSQFDSITQTYDEKLALQSSVTYWGLKKDSHNLVMWATGIISVLVAAGTAAGFIWVAHKFFQGTLAEVQVWKFGVLVAISTFGVWLTRLFGKIFIANLHLRTDAQERETMILTYLAMLREGDVLKAEERELILQVVFRPSTSGYIKDDGPKGFGEMVSALLNRK